MANYYTGDNQFCTMCGATLESGATFCTMCGASVSGQSSYQQTKPVDCTTPAPTPVSAPASAPASAPSAAAGTCPMCGVPLEPGASFCIMCGYPIDSSAGGAPSPSPAPPVSGATTVTGYGDPQPARNVQPASYGAAPSAAASTIADEVADDDPTVRPFLVMLTYDEARRGCQKSITVDGQPVSVQIPPGVEPTTKLDVPGLGYFDEMTGARGPLRLTFFMI